jgi:hypothetical protein
VLAFALANRITLENAARAQKLGVQQREKMIAGAGGVGTTDGPVATATFARPSAITVAPNGTVYVAETVFNGIRKKDATVSLLTRRYRSKGWWEHTGFGNSSP